MQNSRESQETRIRVTEQIIRLAAAYPHAKLTDDTFDVYAEALQDVPTEILQPALIQAAQDSEFFPTLHRIREVITNILFDGTPTAEEAWEEVSQWIAGTKNRLDHPLIVRVVNMLGGWWQLSRSENISVERGQFLKMYANLREREREKLTRTPDYRRLKETVDSTRITSMQIKELESGTEMKVEFEVNGDDNNPLSPEEAKQFLATLLGGKQIGKQL